MTTIWMEPPRAEACDTRPTMVHLRSPSMLRTTPRVDDTTTVRSPGFQVEDAADSLVVPVGPHEIPKLRAGTRLARLADEASGLRWCTRPNSSRPSVPWGFVITDARPPLTWRLPLSVPHALNGDPPPDDAPVAWAGWLPLGKRLSTGV